MLLTDVYYLFVCYGKLQIYGRWRSLSIRGLSACVSEIRIRVQYDDYTTLLGDMGSYTNGQYIMIGLAYGSFKKNLRSWVSIPRSAAIVANCADTTQITQ